MLNWGEKRRWRALNEWFEQACPEPPSVVYDSAGNSYAAAWFRSDAAELLDRIQVHTSILDAHNIAWEEVRTTNPGRIVYSDEFQVVAIPWCNFDGGGLAVDGEAES